MRSVVLSLILSASLLAPCWAAPVEKSANGARLVKDCVAKTNTQGRLDCMIYMNGVVDGILIDQISQQQKNPICLPEGGRSSDVADAVTGFLYTHPQTWQTDAKVSVGVTLQLLYPCKKSNR
jgi:Rap1a immunity proteins